MDHLGLGQVQGSMRVEAVRVVLPEWARGAEQVPRMWKEVLLSAVTRTEREVVCTLTVRPPSIRGGVGGDCPVILAFKSLLRESTSSWFLEAAFSVCA